MLIMEDQSAPDLRRFYLGHAQVNRAAGSPRRCLFGPVDPVETRRFVQEEMRQIYEGQKKRWNFDFELEQPVQGGRYKWERVGCQQQQSRTEAGFGPEGMAEPADRADPVEPAAAAAPAPAAAPPADHPADRSSDRPSDRSSDRPSDRPARQSAITDLFRTRKRGRVTEPTSKATEDGPAPKRTSSPEQDTAPPL